MNQELQIKAQLLELEAKVDKNGHLYYRLSLQGMPNRYYYAFNYNLPPTTWQSLTTPSNWINRQVLITYQETRSIRNTSVVGDQLTNQDGNGTFSKVKDIEIL